MAMYYADGIALMDGHKMVAELVFFPPAAIALNLEIAQNHPELARILAQYPGRPLEVKVATVAAYCNLAVDGQFDEIDLENLINILLQKLKQKSMLFVNSPVATETKQ